MNKNVLALVIASLITATPSISVAQSEFTLEEVIVTATKRGSGSLQELPLAVQVLDGGALRDKGALDFVDFAGSVPSLNFQDLGPGDKRYILRGVNSVGASPVGVYFDEVVISASNANDGGGRNADLKLIDLQSIEVLKGPQSTLYGGNSMAGLIKYVPVKPDFKEMGGFVDAVYSTTAEGGNNYLASAAVNIPLSDYFAARLVGYSGETSGFIDEVRVISSPEKNVNNEDTDGARLLLAYQPSDRFAVDFMYQYQTTQSNGSSRYTPKGVRSFGDSNVPGAEAITATDDLQNTDVVASPWDEEIDLYSLTLQYSTDLGDVTVVSSQFNRSIDYAFDASPLLLFFGTGLLGQTQEPQERKVSTTELRFASTFDGSLNYVLGVYHQNEESDFEVRVPQLDAAGNPYAFSSNAEDNVINGGTAIFGRMDNKELVQDAIFGELYIDVNDKLSLVAGARYFETELKGEEQVTQLLFQSPGGSTPAETNSFEESDTLLKFNASYQLDEDKMVYATVSEGFRFGGLNAANIPFSQNSIPQGFTSDKITNYEVGAKASMLDGRLRINGAVYQIDWEDMQVQSVDDTGTFPFITNAGKAQIRGLEFDGEYLLTEEFSLSFGVGWSDASLKEDQPDLGAGNNVNRGLSGDEIPNVPKLQGSLSLVWETALSDGMDLVIRTDATYLGETNTKFRESSPYNNQLDAYALLDFRAALHLVDDWEISLFVKNLSDKRADIDAINSDQDPLAMVTNRPRTAGLNVRKSF